MLLMSRWHLTWLSVLKCFEDSVDLKSTINGSPFTVLFTSIVCTRVLSPPNVQDDPFKVKDQRDIIKYYPIFHKTRTVAVLVPPPTVILLRIGLHTRVNKHWVNTCNCMQ